MNMLTPTTRLHSLDALRGFDLFWIIGGGFVVHLLASVSTLGFMKTLANQMTHVDWEGFQFYDLIMPLFLFMVGMAIPFSMNKRLAAGESHQKIYLHALKRSAILFVFGGMIQCNFLTLDLSRMFFMHDTLQSIAVGYFFALLIYIKLSLKWQVGVTVLLLLTFWVILYLVPVPGHAAGICTFDVNTSRYFEHWLLGHFDDAPSGYTWVLSSLGFIATVMTGVFASRIIISNTINVSFLKSHNPMIVKSALIAMIGATLVVLGLVIDIKYPMIKHIWNPSFVIFSSGSCFLLIAVFYFIIDVKGFKKWSFWLRVIGMNSIAIYMAVHFINFGTIIHNLIFGLEQFTHDYYPLILSVSALILIYSIMYWMYKKEIFIKV